MADAILTISDNRATVEIGGAAELSAYIEAAAASADEAAGSASAAGASAALAADAAAAVPGVYASTAAGIAAVANGATFWAQGSDGDVALYRRNGAAADLVVSMGYGRPLPLSLFGAKPATWRSSGLSMTAGSPTLTSSTAIFTAADVGKSIVVGSAGTSSTEGLRTTISAFVSSTQVTLAASAGTTVANGAGVYGVDAAGALAAALTAIGAAGGGAIAVDGKYLLTTATSKDFATVGNTVLITGNGGKGRFYMGGGALIDAITLSNVARLVIDGVEFAGIAGVTTDTRRALVLQGCRGEVRNCVFRNLGLAAASAGAAVRATGGKTAFVSNSWIGCNPGGSNYVVHVDDFMAVSFTRDEFLDVGPMDGVSIGKFPSGLGKGWIFVGTQHFTSPNPDGNSVVRLTDVGFDEGCLVHLDVAPTTGRVNHVVCDGIRASTANAATPPTSIRLSKVDYAEFRNCSIGTYVAGTPLHDCITLNDCGDVKINGLRTADFADRISATDCDSVALNECYTQALAMPTLAFAGVDAVSIVQHATAVAYVPVMLAADYSPYSVITGTNSDTVDLSGGDEPAGVWANAAHSHASFPTGKSFFVEFTIDTLGDLAVGLSTAPTAAGPAYNSIPLSFVYGPTEWLSVVSAVPAGEGVAPQAGGVLRIEVDNAVPEIRWKIKQTNTGGVFTTVRTLAGAIGTGPWFADINILGGSAAKVKLSGFGLL